MPIKLQLIFMNATISLLLAILVRLFTLDQDEYKKVWEQAITNSELYNQEMQDYTKIQQHAKKITYYYSGDE